MVKTLPGLNQLRSLEGEALLVFGLVAGTEMANLGKLYLCQTGGTNEESVIPLCMPVCANRSVLKAYSELCLHEGK